MTRGELWNGLVVVYTQSDLTVCDYYRNSEKTTYYALREARGFNILYSRVGRSLRVLRKIAEDPRAPDALLRLGQSLAAMGEKEAACASLGEVLRKYPHASVSVKQGVDREQKRTHC